MPVGSINRPALEHPISASRGLRDTAPYQPHALFVGHKPLSSDRIQVRLTGLPQSKSA